MLSYCALSKREPEQAMMTGVAKTNVGFIIHGPCIVRIF